MDKQVIHTPEVPPARVPLSQAIRAGEWIFVSGQLGNEAAMLQQMQSGAA